MATHIHNATLDPNCQTCRDLHSHLTAAADERREIIRRIDAGEFDDHLSGELLQRALNAWYAVEVTNLDKLEAIIGQQLG